MENEQIGKVKLDYSNYPGEDKYCDGAVEKECRGGVSGNNRGKGKLALPLSSVAHKGEYC